MDLRERRAEIIAEHQAMERYDPYWKAEAAAGRKISERPVAFLCDDDVCLFDGCIAKICAGLQRFLAIVDADPEATQTRSNEPTFASAVKMARSYAVAPASVLRIPQQRWNSVTYALGEVGVAVVLTEGTRLPK